MHLRDITSIVIATTVMLVCLFGVLFFFSTQCFAPSSPRLASGVPPTATAAASQAPASTPTREAEDDAPPATSTAAPTNTPLPPTQAPATAVPPTATPATLEPTATPASNAHADFSGLWVVIDTVTSGTGAGQSFSFDVTLTQSGGQLSGGNAGIQIRGQVEGGTASATYTQPALGLTGTFSWTMTSDGVAVGSFTSSVPNAGTSRLVRR